MDEEVVVIPDYTKPRLETDEDYWFDFFIGVIIGQSLGGVYEVTSRVVVKE